MAAIMQKKKLGGKRKIALVGVEIVVLLIVLGILFVSLKMSKLDSGNKSDVSDAKVEKNQLKESAQEIQTKYTTIAFFGLDNRSMGSLSQGNSDVIILASINESTKEVRLVSVYRDTYLNITDGDGYNKCNAAYAHGGPTQAISMLNVNLDIDIDEYVSFDFNAVTEAIDLLGGVEMEITDQEAHYMTGYIEEVAELTGKTAHYLSCGGTYTLDGVQATAYARVRQTLGDDYKRTERQRLVIEKMVEKAMKSDLKTINSIIDTVFPDIKTSMTSAEILSLAKDAFSYSLGENTGFPFEKTPQDVDNKDCVVAVDLATNVKQLHEFLYDVEDYEVSDEVQEISDYIVNATGLTASTTDSETQEEQE